MTYEQKSDGSYRERCILIRQRANALSLSLLDLNAVGKKRTSGLSLR
jgi:hypothetical protein